MKVRVVGTCSGRNADCLVIPLREGGSVPGAPLKAADRKALQEIIDRGAYSAAPKKVLVLHAPSSPYKCVIAVGLGKKKVTRDTLRQAGGAVAGVLKEQKALNVVVDSRLVREPGAFVEGLLLGQYTYDKEGKAPPDESRLTALTVMAGKRHAAASRKVQTSRVLAECANWARDLANAPGNKMTPTMLAAKATETAEECGCDIEVLDEDAMRDKGMGCLLGVSQGSTEPAHLISLHYTHPRAKRTLCLVGKGLTFDAGGISLKQPQGMEKMRYDMSGGAAVLGAFKAVATLRPAINLVAVVPTSENLPDAGALKPGDVLTAYNGKTVEIISTDAEGRLILADALGYAEKKFAPDAMVDIATLTGAVTLALGHGISAVMSEDDGLVDELVAAGARAHERLWRLPLPDEYFEGLESKTADMKNSGGRAGTIIGGLFLRQFVKKTPWAHIDIAGTAWDLSGASYQDKDCASGFGARLLAQWVLDATG